MLLICNEKDVAQYSKFVEPARTNIVDSFPVVIDDLNESFAKDTLGKKGLHIRVSYIICADM
jgi:hypothetical protein